jgi:AraC-like DNA-binding protein
MTAFSGSRIVYAPTLRRLLRARDVMHERFAAPLTNAELARAAGLSPYHFLRLFHDVFGVTPHQYLTRVRIDEAKRRLARDEASITQACLDVGFSSLGSFSTLFRRYTGASPRRWLRDVRVVVPVAEAWPLLYVPSCFLSRFAGPH